MTGKPANNPNRTVTEPDRQSEMPLGGGLSAKVIEFGVGPPVVFLHGLVGLNDHWEGVVGAVRHRARCVLFELPLLELRGEACSIHGVQAITTRFLREIIGEPAVLVGNSFGGHVALRIAHAAPELVRGLVLAGSSGLYERTMIREIQIRPSRAWLARKIGELFYDQANVWESDIDRAYGELSKRGGARAMIRLSRSARQDHLGDRIATIRTPTLLIWGRMDVVTPPETAEEFHRLIPDSRLVWIDRCGHAPMMEAPGAFSEALVRFLDELGHGVGTTSAAGVTVRASDGTAAAR